MHNLSCNFYVMNPAKCIMVQVDVNKSDEIRGIISVNTNSVLCLYIELNRRFASIVMNMSPFSDENVWQF